MRYLKTTALILILLVLCGCDNGRAELRAMIEQNESGYSFHPFDRCDGMYYGTPERVTFFDPDSGRTYRFDGGSEGYSHLVEVIEDRMYWSTVENDRLQDFAPCTLDTMRRSDSAYVVLEQGEHPPIFLRFDTEKHLYSVLMYMSKDTRPVRVTDEFAVITGVSGESYMTSESKYPYQKDGLTWVSYYRAYREDDSAFYYTVDGGETFTEYITRRTAMRIAAEEAKDPKYQYQSRESVYLLHPDCTADSVEMAYRRPDAGDSAPDLGRNGDYSLNFRSSGRWEKEWTTEHYYTSSVLWAVRLFDQNDPLTSLYIYVDADNGNVVGGGALSD